MGEHLAIQGQEVGTTTGRGRRCGWFDAVAVRHAIEVNSINGATTKLDVLDGLEEVQYVLATNFPIAKRLITCSERDDFAAAKPIYETMPGWSDGTVMTTPDKCRRPRKYVERLVSWLVLD